MPMTLNVGLSRKIGEANYGSRGASVHFAVEVEASLVREPDQLREKIKYLFAQARLAVEEELNGGGQREASGRNGFGHSNGNGASAGSECGSGNGSRHRPSGGNGRLATVSQVRAIHAIASRQRIDLSARLGNDFGVSRPDDLSVADASSLIDSLKSIGAGTGVRR